VNKFIRYFSDCDDCPLSTLDTVTQEVWGEGSGKGRIAFLGEAPGYDEDRIGRPFVGKAGREGLDKVLKVVGIDRPTEWVFNLICCRPPNNQFNSYMGKKAQHCCRKGFKSELVFLREHQYSVIIMMGNSAAAQFGLKQKITSCHGRIYRDMGFILIPVYHPSYIVRSKDDKNNFRKIWVDWVRDFKKIKKIAYGKEKQNG
jgi:DNA polymerase